MKHKLLSAALVLVGSTVISSLPLHASSCNTGALRLVISLDSTTDKMLSAYRESLRGKYVQREEHELLGAISQFDLFTDDLRWSMEQGQHPVTQERLFAVLERGFCGVKSLATQLRICGCTRDLIASAESTMGQIRRTGFDIPRMDRGRPSQHHHHGEFHGGSPGYPRPVTNPRAEDPRELLLRGVIGMLRNR